ncbi:hypothetical protein [Methanobrevibacter sp.]|uniref:hypothetical protein n=1 Tax=Methanobrevibacter sp. TaxID=66852 RepID=UPI0038639A83
MDKRLSFIVVAIAVILIAVGGYLILTNPIGDHVESTDMDLKAHDFKLFSMDTPEGSNFTVKNEADGMKYYLNSGKYSDNISSIIISRNLTESLMGDNSVSISNSTSEQIYSSQFKNETVYKLVSNQGDVDIILMGSDLNLLKELSNTIKIKDMSSL